MTKQEYINRAMLIMNEAGMIDGSGNMLLGADVAQPDRYVEGSYVEAWRRCVKVMPRTWFRAKSFSANVLVKDLADGTGFVVLDDDFYLLSCFRMQGWQKPVYEASIEGDRTSAIQTNSYTRGSEIRPVCTIATRETGGSIKQVLNYYSLRRGLSNHIIETALYIPMCKSLVDMNGTDDLGISQQVVEPLAWLSASTVFTLFEKPGIAKELEARAAELFPGLARARGANVTVVQ
jgi:hypothetical protein